MNPDEVVAAGAAIQGYILSHELMHFLKMSELLQILYRYHLGIETIGGVMNVLCREILVIPVKRKRKYTTDSDYESSVRVKIFEGERKLTKDNFCVGEFELNGLDPAPRGVARLKLHLYRCKWYY